MSLDFDNDTVVSDDADVSTDDLFADESTDEDEDVLAVESTDEEDSTDDAPADADDTTTNNVVTSTSSKMSEAEKITALMVAIGNLDVPACVTAVRSIGRKHGLTTFVARVNEIALARLDADDTDEYRLYRQLKSDVEAAVTASYEKFPSDAIDTDTALVMAYVRTRVESILADRAFSNAFDDALHVENLDSRVEAFLAEHGATDLWLSDDASLSRVRDAAKMGKRAANGSVVRGEPKVPVNGTQGYKRSRGNAADHIAAAIRSYGGRATLQEICKWNDTDQSAGAIRNAFMRGVDGFTMVQEGEHLFVGYENK